VREEEEKKGKRERKESVSRPVVGREKKYNCATPLFVGAIVQTPSALPCCQGSLGLC